jgi:hypothetical protein
VPSRLAALLTLILAALWVGGCAGGSGGDTGATTPTAPAEEVSGHGLRVALPEGFRGRIGRSSGPGGLAVLHVGNVPLPEPGVDDLGGGAVERIPPAGVFLALTEAGEEVAGSVLYASEEIPTISPGELAAGVASGPIPDRAGGVQRFFTVAGRPFSLYVAVGSRADAETLAAQVNGVLATLRIEPRP